MMAVAQLLVGFVLIVAGLWRWSPALALVVAGVLLFVSGGLELRARSPRRSA